MQWVEICLASGFLELPEDVAEVRWPSILVDSTHKHSRVDQVEGVPLKGKGSIEIVKL